MAISNGTLLANLVDPEVIGGMIEQKLINNIVLSPLARVDYTLQGTAGSTITLPYYEYIGDAAVVAEGDAIPISALSAKTKEVSIFKIGKGVKISDEAALSGYGDPVGEAVRQITTSIASGVDAKLLESLNGNTTNVYTTATAEFTVDDIADALTLFKEDIDGPKSIIVDAAAYAVLRKSNEWMPASEISADIILRGTVGQVYGAQVVVSNRVNGGAYHIVKPDALALYIKRDTLVESDRDIEFKYTAITADKHFASYLYMPNNAIKIIKKTA